MRQIAERLVATGHDVTVATSALPARNFRILNGVLIQEFAVSGNMVVGMKGEVSRYHAFLQNNQFDVMMIKAAEQWTFDSLWPILPQLSMQKVFIPCGLPRFYEPSYANYYSKLPNILRAFDHLIFYSSHYRDIDLARSLGLKNFTIIPNGASEIEFDVDEDVSFRQRNGIPEESIVILTVGSFTGLKGHAEVSKAFTLMELEPLQQAVLILNGKTRPFCRNGLSGIYHKIRSNDFRTAIQKIHSIVLGRVLARSHLNDSNISSNKRIIISDYDRQNLIQAFISANLFVFASHVEYSPLVLFESVAAKTPFLSVPVGNSDEIARWTKGGIICPADRDAKGYTRVDPKVLAQHMSCLVRDKELLKRLGAAGHQAWKDRFTWDRISKEYEALFGNLIHGYRQHA